MTTLPATETSAGRKPSIFIGSSTEALPVVNELANYLHPYFEVRPWRETIAVGQYTLTGLLEEIKRVDAAIFVFAKDDKMDIRGEATFSARGNVILEYGLFVAGLGGDRVLILEEEGVNLPSDAIGITTKKYPSTVDFRSDTLKRFAEADVRQKWTKFPSARPRTTSQTQAWAIRPLGPVECGGANGEAYRQLTGGRRLSQGKDRL